MKERNWTHGFWENYQKDRITGMLVIKDGNKETKQQLTVAKFSPDGSNNPDFNEAIEQLTVETLDKNTNERLEKKQREAKGKALREQQKAKQKQLSVLFDAKLQAFEIDEIKNSKNRSLKAKLRKSRNVIEMQVYAQLIIKEELGI
jgi:hypothetical protein|tara:strand:+ start:907 stop:1344 length:438 start_codon:yes stop_codon:yes gene_type:complete